MCRAHVVLSLFRCFLPWRRFFLRRHLFSCRRSLLPWRGLLFGRRFFLRRRLFAGGFFCSAFLRRYLATCCAGFRQPYRNGLLPALNRLPAPAALELTALFLMHRPLYLVLRLLSIFCHKI